MALREPYESVLSDALQAGRRVLRFASRRDMLTWHRQAYREIKREEQDIEKQLGMRLAHTYRALILRPGKPEPNCLTVELRKTPEVVE